MIQSDGYPLSETHITKDERSLFLFSVLLSVQSSKLLANSYPLVPANICKDITHIEHILYPKYNSQQL